MGNGQQNWLKVRLMQHYFTFFYILSFSSLVVYYGGVVRWCWVKHPVSGRGVQLIWIIVGLGPTALAVGAGRGCLDISSLVQHSTIPDDPILTDILSQRAVKPKTTNQPSCCLWGDQLGRWGWLTFSAVASF